MALYDDLDRRLLYELYRDGSISVPVLSKRLGANPSVLYSRIKRLLRRRIIKKFTIQVDDEMLGMGVRAMVGINRNPKLKMQVHEKLMETAEVVSITEVTGRFDILVMVCVGDLATLHTTVLEEIGKIEGVQNTETFVELDRIEKEPAHLKPD